MRQSVLLTTVYCLLTTLSSPAPAALDPDGWTILKPSADSRQLYLDPAAGNDANDGLSSDTPKKSLAAAKALLRNNQPDYLFIKRGTALPGGFDDWRLSGRSPAEPLVITTYGAGDRPIVRCGAGHGIFMIKPVSNLAIVGLDFYANTRDPHSPEWTGKTTGEAGVTASTLVKNILIEDCRVRFFAQNIAFNCGTSSANIAFRRNVSVDAYTTDQANSQGLYISGADGVLIEENVLDQNGSNPDIPAAVEKVFNHNIYIYSNCANVVARGNIIARGSCYGLHMRAGGEVRNNLFLSNSNHLSYGPVNGVHVKPGGIWGIVTDNVFFESKKINGKGLLGGGIELGNIKAGMNTTISHNIFSDRNQCQYPAIRINYPYGYTPENPKDDVGVTDLTLEANIVYKWQSGMEIWNRAATGQLSLHNLTLKDNAIQFTNSNTLISLFGFVPAEHHWSGGVYWDESNPKRGGYEGWWLIKTEAKSLDQWRAAVEPTAKSFQVPYPDPDRAIGGYNKSLGGPDSLDAFLAEARKQAKGNWRAQYTAAAAVNWFREGFGLKPIASATPPDASASHP